LSGSTLKLNAASPCSRAAATNAASKEDPTPWPRLARHHANGQLWRRGVDEPVAGIVLGKEAEPGRPYQLPVFRDHAEVTSAGPTQDVVRELGLLADILNTSGHPIGSPEGRRNKHLGEEGDISRTGRSNVDGHRVSVPHA